MTNVAFISAHRTDDVRSLALKAAPEGVDLPWCLQQIEGWQTARRKLPRWAEASQELWFPPRLSMEQCSSQVTAEYKMRLVERLLEPGERTRMADLTGGFGIDFSFMASLFQHPIYVERLPHLCEIARHNLPLLGLERAEVRHAVCDEVLDGFAPGSFDLLFLDPARRDEAGRKTVALEDCTPNVVALQEALLSRTRWLVLKLSPMLDITQALRSLKGVREVHVVSVRGECKELLLVLGGEEEIQVGDVTYRCANLEAEDEVYCCTEAERRSQPRIWEKALTAGEKDWAGASGPLYLYEPNASILKAGCQDAFCMRYGVWKLHPCSNLFVGEQYLASFPGRRFRIDGASGFGKKELKDLLKGIVQANLTIRNFPTSVADLRKKLKLREGGDAYLFATTQNEGRHVLIKCSPA